MDEQINNAYDITDLRTLITLMRQAGSTARVFGKLSYYIDRNLDHVVFLTATELAKEVGVSQGSVSRFCTALGFRGYYDFQHKLRSLVSSSNRTASEKKQLVELDTMDNLIAETRGNMEALKSVLERREYYNMVNDLAECRRILLLASDVSGTILPYLEFNLSKMGKDVTVLYEGDLMWQTMEMYEQEDTVVFTALFPEYPHNLIFKLERLKDAGIDFMGITDSDVSPLTTLTDQFVSIPIDYDKDIGDMTMPMLFLYILLKDIQSKSEECQKAMKKLDDIQEDTYTYHRVYR